MLQPGEETCSKKHGQHEGPSPAENTRMIHVARCIPIEPPENGGPLINPTRSRPSALI